MHKCNIITHPQRETYNVTVDNACVGYEIEGPFVYVGSNQNNGLITKRLKRSYLCTFRVAIKCRSKRTK